MSRWPYMVKFQYHTQNCSPVSGATVWNDLPPHVTSAPSLATFRQRLKSFLFSQSYSDIHT